jgi:hypothetical protein
MRMVFHVAGFAFATLFALTTTGYAQPVDEPGQQPAARTPDRRPDFLFGPPHGSIGVRGAWVFARAGSDLFDFVTRHLTIDRSDFNVPAFAADVAFRLTPRLDLDAGIELTRMARASEYRDLVDNNLQPIEQTTSLNTTQVTGGVRYALTPRGQDISRLAWVPRKVVPLVGAGAGAVRYAFRQHGDFVDFVDNAVFFDSFTAEGWTPTMYAFAGVDVQIHRGLYASVQGRYTRAAGKLSRDFVDFDPIDLSGFRLSGGINLLF